MSAMNLRETTLLRPGEYPARVKAVTETTSRFDNNPQLQIDAQWRRKRHAVRVLCVHDKLYTGRLEWSRPRASAGIHPGKPGKSFRYGMISFLGIAALDRPRILS